MATPKIKVCGITVLEDALAAIELGVDALGFVFHPQSPRNISAEEAARIIHKLPPYVTTVGVFVNRPPDVVNDIAEKCGLDLVQLHGDEPPEYCRDIRRRVVKAFRVRNRDSLKNLEDYAVSAILLDAYVPGEYGGTGRPFNWDIAKEAAKTKTVVLSGGLTPQNVATAVAAVKPYAVDVSSGVELSGDKRRKDPAKIKMFINNIIRVCP